MRYVHFLRFFSGSALVLALVPPLGTSLAQETDAGGKSVIEQIKERDFGGADRQKIYEMIEKSIADRTRQEAERAAREAELRQMLLSIRDTIFDIELRLTQITNDKSGCLGLRDEHLRLGQDLKTLQQFRGSAERKCAAVGNESSSIDAFCRLRLGEIDQEIRSIEKRRSDIAKTCPNMSGKPEDGR